MAGDVPTFPDRWTSETGGPKRTLPEAEAAINGGNCFGRVSKRVHQYETILQGIFNWLKTTATGLGAERATSDGTAVVTEYFCFTEAQEQETRTVEISRNLTLDEDCLLHVTAVRQKQRQFTRNWERWTVTVVSFDDPESQIVNFAVGTFLGLLGLPATGPAVLAFALGSSISFADLFKSLTAKSIYVAHETAAPETVWKPDGVPTSHVLGSIQLDRAFCEFLREWFPQLFSKTGAPVGASQTPSEQERQ